MNMNKILWSVIVAADVVSSLLIMTCYSTPLNNVYDTQPIYNFMGLDKYYKKRNKGELSFYISPFYQQTSTARNCQGTKVPRVFSTTVDSKTTTRRWGDIQGPWNMFGVFWGTEGAPASKPFTQTNYPNLYDAQQKVSALMSQLETDNRYKPGRDLTKDIYFEPQTDTFAYVTVPFYYEKIGVRGQLNFDFAFGLGMSIRGGAVHIKKNGSINYGSGLPPLPLESTTSPSPGTVTGYSPVNLCSNFVLEHQFEADVINGATKEATDPTKSAVQLWNYLYTPSRREAILKELGIDYCSYCKTSAEDIHAQLYWHIPIVVKDDGCCGYGNGNDNSGDIAVTIVPYIAVGVWLPASKRIDTDKLFAVPPGNDGYYGFTAEASIAFDFPIIPPNCQSLQFCVGGGILSFNDKDLLNTRFPSATPPASDQIGKPSVSTSLQNGIYPWKTDITKRPGLTWYMNASLKANNFLECLSAYFDFVYTQHLRDKISLKSCGVGTGGCDTSYNSCTTCCVPCNPCGPTCNIDQSAFIKGVDKVVCESCWKNQQVNIGFDYRLGSAVSLGGAVQAHISGVRVYRPVTLIGTIDISF